MMVLFTTPFTRQEATDGDHGLGRATALASDGTGRLSAGTAIRATAGRTRADLAPATAHAGGRRAAVHPAGAVRQRRDQRAATVERHAVQRRRLLQGAGTIAPLGVLPGVA